MVYIYKRFQGKVETKTLTSSTCRRRGRWRRCSFALRAQSPSYGRHPPLEVDAGAVRTGPVCTDTPTPALRASERNVVRFRGPGG